MPGVGGNRGRSVGGLQPERTHEVGVTVGDVPVHVERHNLAGIVLGKAEVGEEFILVEEPAGILHALEAAVQDEVAYMIDVHRIAHIGMDTPEGVIFQVDVHLPFECGRRNEGSGGETDQQFGTAGGVHGVDDLIAVILQAVGDQRGNEIDSQSVDEVGVEVGPDIHTAGELAQQVVVWIDSGNPVRHDFLAVFQRVGRVLADCHSFGDEGRQILRTVGGGCGDVVFREGEAFPDEPAVQHHFGMREADVHPVVKTDGVLGAGVGIVARTVRVDVLEQGPCGLIVCIHLGHAGQRR